MKEKRIHEVGLPSIILDIAAKHGDLSPVDRDIVVSTIEGLKRDAEGVHSRMAALTMPRDVYLRQEIRWELVELLEKQDVCESLLSLIRCIPFEIMGEIFKFVANSTSADGRDPSASMRDIGALRLVCKTWNAIAVATHSLWTTIVVDLYVSDRDTMKRAQSKQIRGLMARMNYLGSHPWTLRINRYSDTAMFTETMRSWNKYDGDKNVTDPTADVLPQLLNRPPILHLMKLTIAAGQHDFRLSDLNFPRVTSLNCKIFWELSPSQLLFHLPTLPSLTHAVLETAFPSEIPSNIPWSQITHLFLGGNIPVNQGIAVLKCCTSLERGIFNFKYVDPDVPYPTFANTNDEKVVLPYLTDIAFLESSPFEHARNVASIELPSLKKLRVFTDWRQPFMNVPPGLFNTLAHLTLLHRCWMEGSEVAEACALAPNLTELFVCVQLEAADLISFLTLGHDGKYNLRKLKSLGIFSYAAATAARAKPLDPDDEEEEEEDRREREANEESRYRKPFTVEGMAQLIESRTAGARLGRDIQLERFIIRLDFSSLNWNRMEQDVEDIAKGTLLKVRKVLRPYQLSHGLLASVWVDLAEDDEYKESEKGECYCPVPSETEKLVHWDEGFGGFLDGCEEYDLQSNWRCMNTGDDSMAAVHSVTPTNL